MKLRTMAMVLFGVGALVAGGGCKKKPKEGKAPETGSATMGSGSAGATAGSGSAAAAPEEKLEGKALADKYLACTGYINDAKWDDFQSKCIAKDYQGHAAGEPNTMGPDQVIGWFKDQKTAFPDFKIEPQIVMVNGRNILGVGLMTGTQSGPMKSPMGEVPATNKKIGILMFHRLVIDDENRAAEEWAFADPATMIGQLGLLPKEAPPKRAPIEKGLEGAPIVAVAADDDKEKQNLEAAKAGMTAFSEHKFADAIAHYTDDAVESDQAGDKDATGKKEIQAGMETLAKGFPDFKIVGAPDMWAAGDYVALIGKYEGTNKGAMGKMKPTNKQVAGEFAEVLLMKDGKIAKLWRFRNGMEMAQQLGLMPAPAPAGGDGSAAGGSAAGSGK